MTDDLVGRLKGLLKEATEGPWHLMETGFGKSSSPTIYATDEDLRYVARFSDGPCFHRATPDLANARLAVEAVNALSALLARIEALEGEKALFRRVFEQLDRRRRDAPGHNYDVAGVWDDDTSNGLEAGTLCEWCAMWSETRAALAKDKSDG